MEQEIQNMQRFYNIVIEFFVNYSFQIVGAIIILFIGIYVAKKVASFIEKFLLTKNLDVTLSKFIATSLKLAIIVGVAVIALGKLGITVTPVMAAI